MEAEQQLVCSLTGCSPSEAQGLLQAFGSVEAAVNAHFAHAGARAAGRGRPARRG